MAKINSNEVQGMVLHWLETPVNGYLGSSYGQSEKDMLQQPVSVGIADGFIEKLRSDVSILQSINKSEVNLYSVETGVDKSKIVIDVAGSSFDLKGAR